MNRADAIRLCGDHLKAVRAEYGLAQTAMALALGISKKTLVGIEKGRISLGWTASVALCSLFRESRVLEAALGVGFADALRPLAFEGASVASSDAAPAAWWFVMESKWGFEIQQNMVTQHYRVMTADGERVTSSFSYETVRALYDECLHRAVLPASDERGPS